MNKVISLLTFISMIFCISCTKKSFILNKEELVSTAIIVPDSSSSINSFAAGELKKHLKLLFGTDVEIITDSAKGKHKKYFYVGIRPDNSKREPDQEEAVYDIHKNAVYFYGGDAIYRNYNDENPGEFKDPLLSEVLNLEYNRTGTLSAVYNFLEKEAGVKWIKPGDNGIFFIKDQSLEIPLKEVAWKPELIQRNIRAGGYSYNGQLRYGRYAPKEFMLSEEEALKKQADLTIWMRRMRMGRSENYRFGHAFTAYWEKYKDTYPDIFALNDKGERKPLGRLERVKMCASNPDLVKIIIDEWKSRRETMPEKIVKSISGCENDSDGHGESEWCHCAACNALDARKEGEKLTDYVTDRYVHLWNAVSREARKYQDDILVTGYAYENMLLPPRNEKLGDGILIEFIPRMGGDFEKTKSLYEGWRKAGMKMMMFRPNDMNWEIGIPMGQEERIFSHFKLAIMNNAIGTDFDSMLGFWEGISDITYYILTKGHVDPSASFEQLEEEFLQVFGEAKEDIARYYRHWRNIFNNKIIPEELRLNDGVNTHFLEWHRLYRLTRRIDEFYSVQDFDITDKYLKDAISKNISDQARNYISRMMISNEHSRLTFNAFLAGKGNNKKEIAENAANLVSFRVKNRDKLDINWNVLFQCQHYQMNDQIGTRYLGYLPDDLNPKEF